MYLLYKEGGVGEGIQTSAVTSSAPKLGIQNIWFIHINIVHDQINITSFGDIYTDTM